METIVGKQSIQFRKAPYIGSAASVVGKKEGEKGLSDRCVCMTTHTNTHILTH